MKIVAVGYGIEIFAVLLAFVLVRLPVDLGIWAALIPLIILIIGSVTVTVGLITTKPWRFPRRQ